MCHHGYHSRESLEDEIARKLRAADETDATAEQRDDVPSFLNEERDADVEVLTDGGDAVRSEDTDG